ncbi:MAG: hypothetical protein ACRCUT_04885 [Spirochaetota bacterium]
MLDQLSLAMAKTPEFTAFEKERSSRTKATLSIEGIAPSSFPLLIAAHFNAGKNPLLVITKNQTAMNELVSDLSCFLDERLIAPLPSWEMLPYEYISPS